MAKNIVKDEKYPIFIVSDKNFSINDDYITLLSNIKQRFKNSQIKAAVRINDAMLDFYWSVGFDIVEMQSIHKWGSGVIKQLSLDLRAAFPDKDGFSVRNLEYMKKWYLFYCEHFAKSHQLGSHFSLPKEFSLVPWRHHVHIAYKCKSIEEAMFYIYQTIEQNWSRKELEDNISDNLYAKQGKSLTKRLLKIHFKTQKGTIESPTVPFFLDAMNHVPKNYELCIMNYALFIVSLMSLDRCWLDVHLLALQQ